jgi:hypothetical protein
MIQWDAAPLVADHLAMAGTIARNATVRRTRTSTKRQSPSLKQMKFHRARHIVSGALGVLGAPVFLSSPIVADQPVQAQVFLAGKDVTRSHAADRVRFIPHGQSGYGKASDEIVCRVDQVCVIPPGAYAIDLEAKDVIVQSRPRLIVEAKDTDPLFARLYVVPAGYVEVPAIPKGGKLQALDQAVASLHSKPSTGEVTKLRVPASPVILCAYDADTRPLRCWPVNAKPGETVGLRGLSGPSRGRGQLLVGLKYPQAAPPHDASIALRTRGTLVPPDGIVTTHPDRYFAVWYDAPSGPATIELSSKFWVLGASEGISIPERATAIEWAIPVIRRPTLSVRFQKLERLGDGDVEVQLLSCGDPSDLNIPPTIPNCKLLASEQHVPREPFVFPGLGRARYALQWKKESLAAVRWVDLGDGQSRDETIAVDLAEVRGKITRAGKEFPARVALLLPNESVRARTQTDERGEYSVTVAQTGMYFVAIQGRDRREYSKTCAVQALEESTTCDYDVPPNAVTVMVRTDDGSPLPPDAVVSYRVKSPSTLEELDFGHGLAVGASGTVALPPLPNGTLLVEARARGYRPTSASPLTVSAELGDAEVPVVLAHGSGIRLTILDERGQPAAAARIWSGDYGVVADSLGVAQFDNPLGTGSPLIAFDSGGRMLFTRYDGSDSPVLRIPPSAPAVVIRFQLPNGTPVARAMVSLAVDGVLDNKRFVDQILWAGGDPVSGADGRLRLAGLPATGLLVIYPADHAELAVQRSLPVLDEITVVLPTR